MYIYRHNMSLAQIYRDAIEKRLRGKELRDYCWFIVVLVTKKSKLLEWNLDSTQ